MNNGHYYRIESMKNRLVVSMFHANHIIILLSTKTDNFGFQELEFRSYRKQLHNNFSHQTVE